jgi:hypothetical protein
MNGVANGVYGGDLPNQINTPWIDFSEQSTIVGWSSFATKRIRYKIFGKMLIVSFNLNGTSNATSTSFTLPVNIGSLQAANPSNVIRGTNNGNVIISWANGTPGSNTLNFDYFSAYGVNPGVNGWTSSGTKLISGVYIFEID